MHRTEAPQHDGAARKAIRLQEGPFEEEEEEEEERRKEEEEAEFVDFNLNRTGSPQDKKKEQQEERAGKNEKKMKKKRTVDSFGRRREGGALTALVPQQCTHLNFCIRRTPPSGPFPVVRH